MHIYARMVLESTLWHVLAWHVYIDINRQIPTAVAYNFRLLLPLRIQDIFYLFYIHAIRIHSIITPCRISSHSEAELLERLLGAIEGWALSSAQHGHGWVVAASDEMRSTEGVCWRYRSSPFSPHVSCNRDMCIMCLSNSPHSQYYLILSVVSTACCAKVRDLLYVSSMVIMPFGLKNIFKHQEPPWRDLVFRFMWEPPRESKTCTRERRAKAPRKGCVKVERRKQRRKQSDSRNALKYSCARSFTGKFPRKQPRKVLRNKCRRESQNCARERTAKYRERRRVAKAYED